jgi:3-isopropylmalate/(R)-2-methylmalate dehydratase small subunit
MQPFRVHQGSVAPLDRANIDTDQIIPKQFLKRIERTGFGEFLFYDWRRSKDGKPDQAFPLNQPRYAGASILVAGRNFGCGSSREHAVWALEEFGFRAVVAPSFADIFASNCVQNGMLTVVLPEQQVGVIVERARAIPDYQLTIDLEQLSVADAHGLATGFQIEESTRHRLLNGLDEIGLTLQEEAQIAAHEARHPLPAAANLLF